MRDECRTICLLEMDEPLERVVTAQLDHDGYRIVRGHTLPSVATAEPAPAAIVVDLDSWNPQQWGEDVSWLVRCGRRAPVLVLASDRLSPRREQALGPVTILYKPFTLGELRHRLADCFPGGCGVGQ